MLSLLVPTFNTPVSYLETLLASFRKQRPGLGELIFSDDGSTDEATLCWFATVRGDPHIRVVLAASNQGIARATNAALALARGTFVALLDHDDALADHALVRIARALEAFPETDLLYTDEIVADAEMVPRELVLKPPFDPVLLTGVNYINHLACYRRERLVALGGLREGFDGSQDYELVLRFTRDLGWERVRHLPYPAYIWRKTASSFSTRQLDLATRRARSALMEHVPPGKDIRVGPALVEDLHRPDWSQTRTNWPSVDVLLVARADSPSSRSAKESLPARTDDLNATFLPVDASQLSNAIEASQADVIVLLDPTLAPIQSDWLREMVSCLAFPDVGMVAGRQISRLALIRDAGLALEADGSAGTWLSFQRQGARGPMGRLAVRQSISAVSGACLAISRSCLERIGAPPQDLIDTGEWNVAWSLRARAASIRLISTPFASFLRRSRMPVQVGLSASRVAEYARLLERDFLRSPWEADHWPTSLPVAR